VNTIVVEDFEDKFTSPKTKDFLVALKRWDVQPKEHSLLFTTQVSEPLVLSSKNVGTFKLLTPRSLNLYDVLRADKLILTKSAVEFLEQQYGESQDFKLLQKSCNLYWALFRSKLHFTFGSPLFRVPHSHTANVFCSGRGAMESGVQGRFLRQPQRSRLC
jgi:hypothetical protein